jgi:hypothetical protein
MVKVAWIAIESGLKIMKLNKKCDFKERRFPKERFAYN